MKILWIVNLILPQLAAELGFDNSSSGTWLFEWSKKIASSNNEFAVACVHGDRFRIIKTHGIIFYLLPGSGKNMLFYTKKYEKLWKKIVSDFEPDIINIHGTEYSHGLSCMRAVRNAKYIISLQGILNEIKKVDYGGLKLTEVLVNRTFKENIKFNGMIENHFIHQKNSRYEIEMIKRAYAIAFVNDFDYGFGKSINNKALFFNVDYDMQEVFKQSAKWSYDKCIKYQIFTNPGGTPLKGLHQLLKAVAIVKQEFGDVSVVVPGMGDGSHLIIKNGYSKYINKLIKELRLEGSVKFLNRQTPEEMKNNMLASNVVVIPSAIEGTSLILREAMYLGCPCVCSKRGGMRNFITYGSDGFNYEYDDIASLSEIIKQVFRMSIKDISFLSKNAVLKTSYYDTDSSYISLMNAYKNIVDGEKACL